MKESTMNGNDKNNPKAAGSAAGLNPLVRLAIEAGPLILFFIAYSSGGIFVATGVFMVAVVAALITSRLLSGAFATMPLVSAVVVGVFGGLTLYLHDETFIKLKPTIIYALFAATLLGGLATGKSYLKLVFEAGFPPLQEEGWRLLTLRWGLFFVALAITNEVIWRNFSTDTWVNFKVFGLLPITLIFAVAQIPLTGRYAIGEAADDNDGGEGRDDNPPA